MADKKNFKIEIFAKFPAILTDLKFRKNTRSEYWYFDKEDKLYVLKDGNIIITRKKMERNKIYNLKINQHLKMQLIDITYIRTSQDYKNQRFVHRFNGKEKISTCNINKNIVYLVTAKKPLWILQKKQG